MDSLRFTLNRMILLVVSSFLVVSMIVAAEDVVVTITPSNTVEVQEGKNLSLSCQHTSIKGKKTPPTQWQVPWGGKLSTATADCTVYGQHQEKIAFYGCSEVQTSDYFYYNITLIRPTWDYRGEYGCFWRNYKKTVEVKVLVPVNDVVIEYEIKSGNSSNKPKKKSNIFLPSGSEAVLTCTTECSYPAAEFSWFKNDVEISERAVQRTENCTEPTMAPGSMTIPRDSKIRTISTIKVKGRDVQKREETLANFTCKAKNIRTLQKTVSASQGVEYPDLKADAIQSGPLTQAEIIGIAVAFSGGLLLVLLGIACFLKTRRSRTRKPEDSQYQKPQDV